MSGGNMVFSWTGDGFKVQSSLNGTKLSLFCTISTPVWNLFHFMSFLG